MRIETEHRHPGTRYAVPDNSKVSVFLNGDEISAVHLVHMADEELGLVAYEVRNALAGGDKPSDFLAKGRVEIRLDCSVLPYGPALPIRVEVHAPHGQVIKSNVLYRTQVEIDEMRKLLRNSVAHGIPLEVVTEDGGAVILPGSLVRESVVSIANVLLAHANPA